VPGNVLLPVKVCVPARIASSDDVFGKRRALSQEESEANDEAELDRSPVLQATDNRERSSRAEPTMSKNYCTNSLN
jgi:hypothetical protein